MTPPRIDAHAHVWRRDRTPQPWIDPVAMAAIDRDFWVGDLEREYAAAGIVGGVLVQSSDSAAETRDLLAAAEHADAVLGVVGWLDVAGDVQEQLGLLRAAGGGDRLVGIRHLVHQEADGAWLGGDAVGRGLDALAEAGLPFDLVVRADQLALAAATAAAHPDTRFVLDHLGKPSLGAPGDAWRTSLRRVASLPNVSAKLSGLVSEAGVADWRHEDVVPQLDLALELFGPDRLLFGTDWPLVDLAGGIVRWSAAVDAALAPLAPAERADVLGGTARAVYSLGSARA